MEEWQQYIFTQKILALFPLPVLRSFNMQTSSRHPISFVINATNYRALNSTCLRMGEDTRPLSLSAASSPSVGAHESPIPSLRPPFLNSPLILSTTCLLSLCTRLHLFNLGPRVSLSPSVSITFSRGAATLSSNLDNAGRRAPSTRMFVLSRLRRLGARPDLLPTWEQTTEGAKEAN